MTEHKIIHGDCLEVMQGMGECSVDLLVCSPPYEAARTYNIDFKLKGQDWVDWALPRFLEGYRVSRGVTCWVVEGQTRQFRWSATPALLMADLHRAGVKLRKPPAFYRVGIAGSGGPDWWRNDYEFCVCASHGRLPWSDNTAMGHPPKYAPGGEMSYRNADGKRKNARDKPEVKRARAQQFKLQTRRKANGERARDGLYKPPKKANPGNLIKCHGGGGHLGSPLAHENEAPFPEDLIEWFVLSFCPPGGTVLDCFGGSGTTGAVAKKHGRNSISIDCRESQIELMHRRLSTIQEQMF